MQKDRPAGRRSHVLPPGLSLPFVPCLTLTYSLYGTSTTGRSSKGVPGETQERSGEAEEPGPRSVRPLVGSTEPLLVASNLLPGCPGSCVSWDHF